MSHRITIPRQPITLNRFGFWETRCPRCGTHRTYVGRAAARAGLDSHQRLIH